jgi:Uncharacterised protein family (UPF0158)
LLVYLAWLRRDDALFNDIVGWRGNRLPITAVVANLADPRDVERKKAAARVRRAMRSQVQSNAASDTEVARRCRWKACRSSGMSDEQSRRRVRVDFEELRFAMEDASYEHQYFLDTETGEVILISEYDDDEESTQRLEAIDEAEPGRYLPVPRAESSDGYQDMQEFIDTVSDKQLQQLLEVAIHGKGAFRRFKDVLARDPAEQQRWFAFQMERLDTRVREWLADEGVRSEPT